MPSERTVAEALKLIRSSPSTATFFFNELSGPSWLRPLTEGGAFAAPPRPETFPGGESHPYWAALGYLKRMAPLAPVETAEALLSVPVSQNHTVHAQACLVAAALPGRAIDEWAMQEALWLGKQERLLMFLPNAAADLAVHLAQAGQLDAAKALMEALVRVQLPAEPKDHEAWHLRLEAQPPYDRWEFAEILGKQFLAVAELDPAWAVSHLIATLKGALPPESEDGSQFWYSDLTESSEDAYEDASRALAAALRDRAADLAAEGQSATEETWETLASQSPSIFTRLGLYTLQVAHPSEALLETVLLDPDLIWNRRVRREYTQLLKSRFRRMGGRARRQWTLLVSQVPPDTRRPSGEVERDWLASVEDWLPSSSKTRLAELTATFGEPCELGLPAFQVGHSWGSKSPLPVEQIRSMQVRRIVAYLQKWRGPESPRFDEPDRDGLVSALTTAVADSPAKYADRAELLRDLPPVFLTAILHGLDRALGQKRSFKWPGVLQLAETIMGTAVCDESEDSPYWTQRALVSLVWSGVQRHAIPKDNLRDVGVLVERLLEMPSIDLEPVMTVDHTDIRSPLTASMNSRTGVSVHLAIAVLIEAKITDISLKSTQTSVRRFAARSLKTDSATAIEVAAALGSALGVIGWIDPKWLAEACRQAVCGPRSVLHAFWSTYLVYGRPQTLVWKCCSNLYDTLLHEPLDLSLMREVVERSGSHYAVYYLWEQVDLGDLLSMAESSGHATELAESMSKTLADACLKSPSRTFSERAVAFWDVLESAALLTPEVAATFDDWARCDQLPLDWRLKTWRAAIQRAGRVEHDYRSIEWLVQLDHAYMDLALECLIGIVEASSSAHAVSLSRRSLPSFLAAALQDPDHSAAAERVIGSLIRAGNTGYADLLRPEGS